jgi:hypothetical protein
MSRRKERPLYSESNTRIHLSLARTPFLEKIAGQIELRAPSWENVFERMRASNKKGDWQQITGYIGETILQEFLDDMAYNFPTRIVNNPIADGTTTEHYIFAKQGDRMLVSAKRGLLSGSSTITDYDGVTVVDGYPVIWENKFHSPEDLRAPGTVSEAMQFGKIGVVTHPIRELFQKDCGYVLVTHTGGLFGLDSAVSLFRSRGGIALRIPVSGRTLYEKAHEFLSIPLPDSE